MSARTSYPLLETIDSPADLRALAPNQLEQVAAELRQYLIETVSQMGGHFAGQVCKGREMIECRGEFSSSSEAVPHHSGGPIRIRRTRANDTRDLCTKGSRARGRRAAGVQMIKRGGGCA